MIIYKVNTFYEWEGHLWLWREISLNDKYDRTRNKNSVLFKTSCLSFDGQEHICFWNFTCFGRHDHQICKLKTRSNAFCTPFSAVIKIANIDFETNWPLSHATNYQETVENGKNTNFYYFCFNFPNFISFSKLFVLSLCVLLPLLTRSHVVMGRFNVDMKEGGTGESPPSPVSPFSHSFLPFCMSILALILPSPLSSNLPPHFLQSLPPPSPSLPSSCTSVWNILIYQLNSDSGPYIEGNEGAIAKQIISNMIQQNDVIWF